MGGVAGHLCSRSCIGKEWRSLTLWYGRTYGSRACWYWWSGNCSTVECFWQWCSHGWSRHRACYRFYTCTCVYSRCEWRTFLSFWAVSHRERISDRSGASLNDSPTGHDWDIVKLITFIARDLVGLPRLYLRFWLLIGNGPQHCDLC